MRIKQSSTLVGSGESNQYRSIALAAAELTWIQSLLSELGCTSSSPPTIWCDNLGATYLAANLVFHARHVEFYFHFVREKVSNRQLLVRKTTSSQQIADIFTKSLAASRFNFIRDKLTISPVSLEGAVRITLHWTPQIHT